MVDAGDGCRLVNGAQTNASRPSEAATTWLAGWGEQTEATTTTTDTQGHASLANSRGHRILTERREQFVPLRPLPAGRQADAEPCQVERDRQTGEEREERRGGHDRVEEEADERTRGGTGSMTDTTEAERERSRATGR
eukprot:GHVU01160941.1.p2 GENE.GHVU01160941.1~~GHVU01160941.1.p2  ORF type:complete len:138 (+),score=20.66 GHVU01160941.1:208-621(+)